MLERRRPLFGVLVALLVCVSLWQIALQEAQFIPEYESIDVPAQLLSTPLVHITNGSTHAPAVSVDQLSAHDLQQLIDLDNFDYIIPQPPCPVHTDSPNNTTSTSIITLIFVHSAPNNWNKRNVIRETWGRENPNARLLFLLGAVDSKKLQHKLEQENFLFGDLLQGNFVDAYRNMTYKHVMGLKWFVYNCPDVKYLLKTDDDVFVNTPNMFEFMLDPNAQRREMLMCKRITNGLISRSFRSKWRVRIKEFPGHYYPTYCPGYTIVYSADTVFALYREAQRTPYFWIDDVHVTGTLAAAANLEITQIGTAYMPWSTMQEFLDGHLDPEYELFLITVPNLTEKQIRALWAQVSKAKNRSGVQQQQPSSLNDLNTIMNR